MKIITPEQAALLVNDGDVLATSGFMISGHPEELTEALEKRFLAEGHPRDLTAIASGGQGDWVDQGLDHLANEGMLKRLIQGYLGCEPRIGKMINENLIECYNFPIGVVSAMFRAVSQGKEGELTKIGLKTYLDPRKEGGRMNERTQEELVELMEFRGQEYLFYKAPRINIAFIRGTYGDDDGNITFDDEVCPYDTVEIAMAAKACGGIVVAQVKNIAASGSLRPHDVKIPGNFVDYMVVCSNEEKYHRMTVQYASHPALVSRLRVSESKDAPLPLDVRKVIARRAAMELTHGSTVNMGIGLPESIGPVAVEEGVKDVLFTSESGLYGGKLLGGYSFGAGMNNWAVTPMNSVFDFYMGGGLAATFLGMAQVNGQGDVNVARFEGRITGSGGFVSISQPTKKVVFCGTLTAGGLEEEVTPSGIRIVREGRTRKFINSILQATFSGEYAVESGQEVLWVTERCVFRLTPKGLELIEVAPGMDIERDILAHMEFMPVIPNDVKTMNARLYSPGPMGLGAMMR